MKKFLSLILCMFAMAFIFTGCGINSGYIFGDIKDGVYINKSLGIKYTPSDKMVIVNDEYRHVGSMPRNIKIREFCGIIPMQNKNVKSVTIYAANGNDRSWMTEESLVKSYMEEMTKYDENMKLFAIVCDKYKIGNTEFTKVLNPYDGEVVLLKKIDDTFVEIIIKNFTAEEVNEVLSGFSELQNKKL